MKLILTKGLGVGSEVIKTLTPKHLKSIKSIDKSIREFLTDPENKKNYVIQSYCRYLYNKDCQRIDIDFGDYQYFLSVIGVDNETFGKFINPPKKSTDSKKSSKSKVKDLVKDINLRKKLMLTTGKLIKWLQKFPEDTLVLAIEGNTATYQEVPDFEEGNDDRNGNGQFMKLSFCRKDTLEYYKKWFDDEVNSRRAKKEYNRVFKYCSDLDEAVVIG